MASPSASHGVHHWLMSMLLLSPPVSVGVVEMAVEEQVVLAVTVVFFFALGALTLWSSNDMPRNTETKALYVP